MVDFLQAVDTDQGKKEPIPATLVSAGAEVGTSSNPLPVTAQGTEYETVAASQTDQVLGATGAIGDLLVGLIIIPASTSPGAVSIKDGGGSAITIFAGGANSVSNLVPFGIGLGIKATGAGWKVTTGAGVSVIGVGDFT